VVTNDRPSGSRRVSGAPHRRLSAVTLVVRDYDEAIAWYREKLGFVLIEDTLLEPGKRWVLMAATAAAETRLLLARAVAPAQAVRIGDQTGGRVAMFLETDDFQRDFAAMSAAGVRFVRTPREEAYGTVAVFEDLYGTKWDLIESRR
jgi:catechol 2,3-dioxygenase-like lactoylglutathione lyase family enzyme